MDSILIFLQLHQFQYSDLFVVAVLIVMEGLLSCDNAVVLALLVRNLPEEQRGKALRYGIWGAYLFRIVALSMIVWLLQYWWIKFIGGLYLAWMAINHFRSSGDGDDGAEAPRKVKLILGLGAFWSTVVWVELTDIAFSVDSIGAAIAVSTKLWVIILGGLLGILAMRFAAQGFVKLLEKFPKLESAAFVAVGVVGLRLCLEFPIDLIGFKFDVPPGATYATAQEYSEIIEKANDPLIRINHTLTINSKAPSTAPSMQIIESEIVKRKHGGVSPGNADKILELKEEVKIEYQKSEVAWALRYRPFMEVEGWLTSLIVIIIFAFGFLRPQTNKKD